MAALIPELDGTWLDTVGRWPNKASASYIRTQLQRARIIQTKVAAVSRNLAASTAAEEEVYAQFGSHLVNQGSSMGLAVERAASLQHALVDMRARLEVTTFAPVEEPQKPEDEIDDLASTLDACEFVRHVASGPTGISVPLGTYVISTHPKTSFRRLHVRGSCSYRPGFDAKLFEVLGTELPELSHYHARCKSCFKTALALPRPDGFDIASSSGSSSESEAE